MIAKETLIFAKIKSICELEERHGADLGSEFQNDNACATSIQFIPCEQQDILSPLMGRCVLGMNFSPSDTSVVEHLKDVLTPSRERSNTWSLTSGKPKWLALVVTEPMPTLHRVVWGACLHVKCHGFLSFGVFRIASSCQWKMLWNPHFLLRWRSFFCDFTIYMKSLIKMCGCLVKCDIVQTKCPGTF